MPSKKYFPARTATNHRGIQTACSIHSADGINVCSTSVMLVAAVAGCMVSHGEDVMELAVLIIGLLVAGSQIPGNSHIILR
jgi:hypothetical protein